MTLTHDPQPYVTDDAHGDAWHLMLGDSCERLAEIPDSSIGLTVYSPPFASLFTYSPSERDLGNSSSRDEFITHYGYIVDELLRVTMPGRSVEGSLTVRHAGPAITIVDGNSIGSISIGESLAPAWFKPSFRVP